MIKFVLTAPAGKRVLGLGLSADNIKRLQNGQPILFDAGEIGIPNLDVLIIAGETEDEIQEELQKKFKVKKVEKK